MAVENVQHGYIEPRSSNWEQSISQWIHFFLVAAILGGPQDLENVEANAYFIHVRLPIYRQDGAA